MQVSSQELDESADGNHGGGGHRVQDVEVGDEGDVDLNMVFREKIKKIRENVDRRVRRVEGRRQHRREGGQQGVGQGKFEHLEGDKEVDEEEEDHDGVPGPGVEGEKSTNQSKGDCSERGVEKEERGGSEVRRCHVVLLWSLRRKKHFFARALFFWKLCLGEGRLFNHLAEEMALTSRL